MLRCATSTRANTPMSRSVDAPALAPLGMRRYGASPGGHAHAHYQVLWGWTGCLALDIAGRSERIVPGTVTLIAPGERHDFHAARPATCLVLDTFDERLDALPRQRLAVPQALQSWLATHLHAQPAHVPTPAALLVTELLDAVHPRRGTRPQRQRPIDWVRLHAWVSARLSAQVCVDDLAHQVAMSPSQFAARCEAETGYSPLAWVRQTRLAAARALRAQGIPVHRVAALCGYRSPSALTAAMRREQSRLTQPLG